MPKAEFEQTNATFANRLTFTPERIDELVKAILIVWEQRQLQVQQVAVQTTSRRQELETQIKIIVDKMKLISSATAIKYMEEDLLQIEQQLTNLDSEKEADTILR